jgi:hypothetical protein
MLMSRRTAKAVRVDTVRWPESKRPLRLRVVARIEAQQISTRRTCSRLSGKFSVRVLGLCTKSRKLSMHAAAQHRAAVGTRSQSATCWCGEAACAAPHSTIYATRSLYSGLGSLARRLVVVIELTAWIRPHELEPHRLRAHGATGGRHGRKSFFRCHVKPFQPKRCCL